jgi:asparagine synthase (glutamine-hydrolysing)
MMSVLAEGKNVRASQTFCDHHLSCGSASLVFQNLQPYISPDLAVWLDGEIYDFGEFATDIAGQATGQIADLYRRHSLTFFKSIDGIFTAVIYDRARLELHLINDRYGLRRLYIWEEKSSLAWASGVRSLLYAPDFTPRIESEAVDTFLDLGHLLDQMTWFRNVRLLSSATVFTWNIRANCGKETRYWWWDEIKLRDGHLDEAEVTEALGNLFCRGVERRVRSGERVGSELSGGRDSRAVVASIPDCRDVVNTITVGTEGCPDRLIAGQVAAVRAATAHHFSLDATNWLLPRFRGIWLTDGQSNLLHMHCIEAARLYTSLFDVCLSGFAGELVLGGSWLASDALDVPVTAALAKRLGHTGITVNIPEQFRELKKTDFYFIHNRANRFTYNGIIMLADDVEMRMPFFDNKLIEFTYSLPDIFRLDGRIYNKMLMHKFPKYYRRITWQKTGNPISIPNHLGRLLHLTRRAGRKLSRLSGGFFSDPLARDYTDYPNWLRQEPARHVFTTLFNNPKAIYPDYISKKAVQSTWNEHLRGRDNAETICIYATFEIWLQQAFEKRLRAEVDVDANLEAPGMPTKGRPSRRVVAAAAAE